MKRGVSLFAWALAVAALFAVAGCSRPHNDAQIASDAQHRIYSDPGIHTRQVRIESRNGIVTLYGSTASDPERFAAAADAASVDGVKTVVNNLQVMPAAPTPAAAPAAPAPQPAPAAPAVPAAERPAGPALQRAAVDDATAHPTRPRWSSEAQARRPRAHSTEPRESAGGAKTAASNSSGLPYSTSAPPSSPVGASPAPAQPAMTASASQAPVAAAVAAAPKAEPAAAPASAAPATAVVPMSATVPPPPKPVTIPSGTAISVRLLDRIDSESSHPGDSFRATLNTPLVDDSGATVVPTGYEVTGKIVDAKSAGRFAGSSALALELTQLSVNGKQYALQTNQYTRRGKSRGRSTAEKVGGGAAVGAILGGIFGGAKGAAIGATVGAGAGTGVSATGKGEQIVLRPETVLNFELEDPLSVLPTTQSPHGNRVNQQAGTAAGDHSSAADSGPPVLKRRGQ